MLKSWRISSQTAWLASLAMIALALRLLWVFSVGNDMSAGDAWWYDARAVALAAGEGYHVNGVPTAFFPVGYPGFLAAIYTLFGHSLLAAKMANVLLGTVNCLLTFILGIRAFGPREGRIAGLLMAVYPNQIFYTSLLMSEILFSCVLLLSLILWSQGLVSSGRRSWIFWAAAGVVSGLTCLVRPIALLLTPFLALWYGVRGRGFLRIFPRAIAAFACTLLTIAPWTLRNYHVFGKLIPVSTNGGENFWWGNNPGSLGTTDFGNVPDALRSRAQFDEKRAGSDEVTADRYGYRLGIEAIRGHPWQVLRNLPWKLLRLFYAEVEGLLLNAHALDLYSPKQILGAMKRLPIPLPNIAKQTLALLSQFFYVAILLLACIGMGKHIPNHNVRVNALIGTILYWVGMHLIYLGGGRYRFPIMPLLTLFSASALAALWDRCRAHFHGLARERAL